MTDKKRCKYPKCTTDLHEGHKGDYCYHHEDLLGENPEALKILSYYAKDNEVKTQEITGMLTISEVAKVIKYSERAIRKMLKDGSIKGIQRKPLAKWLIPRSGMFKLFARLRAITAPTRSAGGRPGPCEKAIPLSWSRVIVASLIASCNTLMAAF